MYWGRDIGRTVNLLLFMDVVCQSRPLERGRVYQ